MMYSFIGWLVVWLVVFAALFIAYGFGRWRERYQRVQARDRAAILRRRARHERGVQVLHDFEKTTAETEEAEFAAMMADPDVVELRAVATKTAPLSDPFRKSKRRTIGVPRSRSWAALKWHFTDVGRS